MVRLKRRRYALALVVLALSFLVLGCTLTDDIFYGTADPTEKNIDDDPSADEPDDEPAAVPEGSAEGIVFSFSGDNLSYHTGLLNETTIYLNYDKGTAWANESRSFEEAAGTTQVRTGTDTVNFDGTYDHANKSFSGTLKIKTEGRASGGEDASTNDLTYVMTGQMKASLVDGVWVGTVTGNSTLAQVWVNSPLSSDDKTERTVNWTANSVAIEKFR